MYLMHLVILHYCNVTWLIIPLWIYGRTWTLLGFFNMGNTLPKLHQINGITYNSGPNVIHGGTITSSNVYHKAIEWFHHHMNGLVLLKKVHSELGHFEIKRTYSLFAPHYHWRGMYAQVRNIIARCEQCDRVKTSFSF